MTWEKHFSQVNEYSFGPFGAELVATKWTKLTADQAAQALVSAYKQVTGSKPSITVLGFMLAQTGLETGQWNLPGNNWGGVKFSSSRDKYYQFLSCGEVDPATGIETKYPAGDPHCVFAAYATPADGAVHYVKTLKNREHWWKGLHAKTLDEFVAGLQAVKGQFYMTANANTYKAGMQRMLNQFGDVAKKYGSSIGWFWKTLAVAVPIAGGVVGYRALKANPRISGLGDVVKAGTEAVGIKPCLPCQRRAAWLNRKFPL